MAPTSAIYASILTRVERPQLQKQLQQIVHNDLASLRRHLGHVAASITALRQLQAAARHVRPRGDWLPATLETRFQRIETLETELLMTVNRFGAALSGKRIERKRKRERDKTLLIEGRGKRVETVAVGTNETSEDYVETRRDGEKKMETDASVETDVDDETLDVVRGATEDEEAAQVIMWCSKRDQAETEMVAAAIGEQKQQQQQRMDNDVDDERRDAVTVNTIMADKEGDRKQLRRLAVWDNKESIDGLQQMSRDTPVRVKENTARGDSGRDTPEEEGHTPGARDMTNKAAIVLQDARIHVKEEKVMCELDPSEEQRPGSIAKRPVHTGVLKVQDALVRIKKEKSPPEAGERPELEHHDVVAEVAKSCLRHTENSATFSEWAMELEVPDSESDDDFFSVREAVARLKTTRVSTQLVLFPAAVDQLRAYLVDHKYMTVVEMDGFLFAHKPITDEEIHEIGCTIETIISVAMKLPMRPKIELALYDLFATVEQLELTLGELPKSLRPATDKLSTHIQKHVGKSARSWEV